MKKMMTKKIMIVTMSIFLLGTVFGNAQAKEISAGASLGSYDFGFSLEFQGYYEHINESNFGARAGLNVSFSNSFKDSSDFFGASGAAPDSSFSSIADYKGISSYDVHEKGLNTTLSLDALYDLSDILANVFSANNLPFTASIYAGPRINSFTASIEINKSPSSVSTKQFGFGFGALAFLNISDRLRLVGDFGVDLYLNPTLKLDGNFGNSEIRTDDDIYASYNELINQPTYAPRAKIGLIYTF